MINKSISDKYQVKIPDSQQSSDDFDSTLKWLRINDIEYYSRYEPDGDYHGYWVFRFEKEEDKVRFILKWL